VSETGTVEVWRGTVAAWECDGMGHLNVRFHLLRAMQGLAGAAAALGMPHAFAPHAAATLIVREHHVRFLREAREGAIQHMTASVVAMGEHDATLQFTLFNSAGGEVSSTFLTRVVHASAREGRPFPWPGRAREAAAAMTGEVAANAGPRSVQPGFEAPALTPDEAVARGLTLAGLSVVVPEDCDVFGRLRTEMVMGRISASIGHTVEPFRRAAQEAMPSLRMGGAAMEYRLVYFDHPRAGDRIAVHAGIVGADRKMARMRHWLLDPATGAPWAVAENVSVNFDLDSRKAVLVPEDAVAKLQSVVATG
jgi:acyl-CoA thioester hydrolase